MIVLALQGSVIVLIGDSQQISIVASGMKVSQVSLVFGGDCFMLRVLSQDNSVILAINTAV